MEGTVRTGVRTCPVNRRYDIHVDLLSVHRRSRRACERKSRSEKGGNLNGHSGKLAIVGIGETEFYKRGASPHSELALTLQAVRRAASDAGLDVRAIDGFASFSNDATTPDKLAATLGSHNLAWGNMVWGGGGGGCVAAIGNAAAAVAAGIANYVVVYRGLSQGNARFGAGGYPATGEHGYLDFRPHGLLAPSQSIALQVRRFMHVHGISPEPLAAVALTSYRHAQSNPRAIMNGKPLTRAQYDGARWIVEPFRLYDCCQENDGAAAVIVTTLERAHDLSARPAHIAGAMQGATPRFAGRDAAATAFGSANFMLVARRLYEATGLTPSDVDVVQCYENFSGCVVAALIEHGFCDPEEANDFMTEETFRYDGGRLPLNTSGGNLAEGYIHGLQLVNEAVRQVRGESTCQVVDASCAMVIGGPFDQYVSNLVIAKESN